MKLNQNYYKNKHQLWIEHLQHFWFTFESWTCWVKTVHDIFKFRRC